MPAADRSVAAPAPSTAVSPPSGPPVGPPVAGPPPTPAAAPPTGSPVPGPPPPGAPRRSRRQEKRQGTEVARVDASPSVPINHRHIDLVDLPPAVAAKLNFDKAAPKRFRSDNLPEDVQDELRDLWNGIVADIYDEVAGLRRTKALGRESVERALRRIAGRLLQAERVVIVAGVSYPMKGDNAWKHVAVAGAGGGGSAVAEEVAAFGTMGTATTVAIVSAVVGEVFETYVASSARTRQYLSAGRSPDPAIVLIDLAEAAGYGDSAGRRVSARVAHDAAAWLGEQLVKRTATRFARSLIPVFGVGVGAGISAVGVRRVTKLPLRPVSQSELDRFHAELAASDETWR